MGDVQGTGTGPSDLAGIAGFCGGVATASVAGGETGDLGSSAMLRSVVVVKRLSPALAPEGALITRHLASLKRRRDTNRPSTTERLPPGCLKAFDQVADAQRVGFAMAVTGDRIGASARLNYDVGPKDSG